MRDLGKDYFPPQCCGQYGKHEFAKTVVLATGIPPGYSGESSFLKTAQQGGIIIISRLTDNPQRSLGEVGFAEKVDDPAKLRLNWGVRLFGQQRFELFPISVSHMSSP